MAQCWCKRVWRGDRHLDVVGGEDEEGVTVKVWMVGYVDVSVGGC